MGTENLSLFWSIFPLLPLMSFPRSRESTMRRADREDGSPLPAKSRIDWDLPDPANMPPPEFNKVRDQIQRRVAELIEHLKVDKQLPS